MLAAELTVGQVAARSGVTISTLHFYESKGLIRSRRSGGNQRRYARDVLRRIGLPRVSKRVDISLDDTGRARKELPDSRTPREENWPGLAKAWRENLEPYRATVAASGQSHRLHRLRLPHDRLLSPL